MGDIIKQPASAKLGKGSTRVVDLMLEESDLSTRDKMRWRSGVVFTGSTVESSASWVFHSGRQALRIGSDIGNGWFSQYGLAPTIERVANVGALALHAGVIRLVVSMAVGDLSGVTNANSDIGVDCLIGVPSGMSDLRTNNNTHLAGSSGMGVLLMLSGKWAFLVKQADTGAGVFSEATDLPASVQVLLNSGEPVEIEFRITDATASSEAMLELFIDGSKVLTRYWVNPAGVASAVLPPMGIAGPGVTGTVLILQLRNTSTGPPDMFFYQPSLIQGPNDAGTL